MIRNLLALWEADPRGRAMRGAIFVNQADAASHFVLGAHEYLEAVLLTAEMDLELHSALRKMALFCLYVSNEPTARRVRTSVDRKHCAKPLRNRLISKTGVTIHSTCFNQEFWRAVLMHPAMGEDVLTKAQFDALFILGSAERMGVKTVVKLLIAIKKAAEKSAPDFQLGPHFEGVQWLALQILARICDLWLDLLSRKRTLRDQLISVSRLSHLYLACYRQNGTSFLPAQNYRSTQSMNMAVFHTVVCCQLEGIDEYWLILDDDDRLENNFNVLRMMFGNGQNFDQLQHEQRQSGAMQLSDIYARKPHLYKGAKHRVVRSADGISTLDHSNPKDYYCDNGVPKPERVEVTGLSVPTCWLIGRQQAQKDLIASAFKPSSVDFVALAADGQIDMLRPSGKWVGVSNE